MRRFQICALLCTSPEEDVVQCVLFVSEQTTDVYVHCVLVCSLCLSRLEMSMSIHCLLVVSEQTRDVYVHCVSCV